MHNWLFLLLIFYDFLESFVPLANYWDELAAFLVLCWGLTSLRKDPRLNRTEWKNWILLTAMILLGALGNLFHPGLQDSWVPMVKDVVALSKFPVIFFVLQRRTDVPALREKRIGDIAKISRWIILVTLLAMVFGRFVDLGFYTGEVRILPTFQFVFTHPTFYISSCVMMAAALMAESIRKNRIFLLLDCLLIFMAQRTKGYIFIAFLVMFLLLGEAWMTKILTLIFGSGKEKLKPGRLLLAAVVLVLMILVVGKNRLQETVNIGFPVPRTVLHLVGFQILMDYFPLGSGFGTFASHLSGRHYSNIYDLYGISDVIGMNREDYTFISDVFWPYIYGQFGLFGALIYVKLLVDLFLQQFRANIPDASRVALALVWIYALIATTSEAYFTNGTGVQMALFLTMFLGYGSREDAKMTL